MRTRALGPGFLLAVLLGACAGSTGGPSAGNDATPTPTPTPGPTATACPSPAPTDELATPADGSPAPSACSAVGGGGGGGGAGGGGGGAGGGPGGTVHVKWNEHVIQNGDGVSSDIAQTYEATISLTLTKVDIGGWTFTGSADISGTFTSDAQSHTTTSLGPCNTHYTDNAGANGTVDVVDGGLEARDGLYQFYVNVPGVDGSNDTVRDDSGCFGPNNRETTPWSAAPATFSGDGNYTDLTHITGSSSQPRQGGEDTITWDFTIEP